MTVPQQRTKFHPSKLGWFPDSSKSHQANVMESSSHPLNFNNGTAIFNERVVEIRLVTCSSVVGAYIPSVDKWFFRFSIRGELSHATVLPKQRIEPVRNQSGDSTTTTGYNG